MNITTGLASDLRRLTAALDEPGADIAQSLHKMAADTQAAVRSYLGLNVSVSRSDPLFTFTYLNDGVVAGDIATSLRLTLPSIGDSWAPPAVALILYAGSPGAFVDLAADLAWLTARPLGDFVLDQHLTIPAGSDSGAQLSSCVGHQPGHRGSHRPRLHPPAGRLATRHPGRPCRHRPLRRRPAHPRHAHRRRRRTGLRHPVRVSVATPNSLAAPIVGK